MDHSVEWFFLDDHSEEWSRRMGMLLQLGGTAHSEESSDHSEDKG